MMDKIKAIVQKKPQLFFIVSIGYLLLTGFLRWKLQPVSGALLYLAGGIVGIYFLDTAEVFFNLTPSPFRSIVFQTLFAAVSFFIISSSGSLFASGLVLILYLTLLLLCLGELKVVGNLGSWYRMVAGDVPVKTQRIILVIFTGIFLLETYLFIRFA